MFTFWAHCISHFVGILVECFECVFWLADKFWNKYSCNLLPFYPIHLGFFLCQLLSCYDGLLNCITSFAVYLNVTMQSISCVFTHFSAEPVLKDYFASHILYHRSIEMQSRVNETVCIMISSFILTKSVISFFLKDILLVLLIAQVFAIFCSAICWLFQLTIGNNALLIDCFIASIFVLLEASLGNVA